MVELDDFFVLPEQNPYRENILEPGEIITKIIVPEPDSGTASMFIKSRMRDSWDFATVSIAVMLGLSGKTVKDVRIVFGGVAPKPWFEERVSAQLKGKNLTKELLEKISAQALADAEPMDKNAYKLILARNLLKQTLESFL